MLPRICFSIVAGSSVLLGFASFAFAGSESAPPEGEPIAGHMESIVIIEGNQGTGTGFVTEMRGSLFVVTNLHVLSGNDTFSLRTAAGRRLLPAEMFGAVGHDIAILRIREESFQPTPLPYEPDIHTFVNRDDEILVLGNSEGRGTVLATPGKVVGLGPARIEIDNPVYPGNSGSPILHSSTGRAIGVVSFAQKSDQSDFVSRASRENERSAVRGPVRYFGYRLDSVERWERIDWARFRQENATLSAFQKNSETIRSFMFSDDRVFEQNPTLKRAFDEFVRRTSGRPADVERINAANHFLRQLQNCVVEGVSGLERQKNGFYDYHRKRAEEELVMRKALEGAIESFRSDFRRLEQQIIR